MKRINVLILTTLCCAFVMAQEVDSIADTTAVQLPVWKQKLYCGYNFDIYFHHDSKANTKENGWSITVEPEIGWKLKERLYLGLRVGGSYQDTYTTYPTRGAHVTTAAELDARAVLDHAHVIAVLLAEQCHRTHLFRLGDRRVAALLQRHIAADKIVGKYLHLTHLFGCHLLEVAKVEA